MWRPNHCSPVETGGRFIQEHSVEGRLWLPAPTQSIRGRPAVMRFVSEISELKTSSTLLMKCQRCIFFKLAKSDHGTAMKRSCVNVWITLNVFFNWYGNSLFVFQPICDSKQTTHKEQNSHSEGVSSAASHPEESSGKKSSSPDVDGLH